MRSWSPHPNASSKRPKPKVVCEDILDTHRCTRRARETTRTRRTLQRKRKGGCSDTSVGKCSMGLVSLSPIGSCWNHPVVLHPWQTQSPKGYLDLSSYLCHLRLPSLAHLVWIPISSSVIPAPLVAYHGARHGNSSRFLIIAIRHLGSKVLEKNKRECMRKWGQGSELKCRTHHPIMGQTDIMRLLMGCAKLDNNITCQIVLPKCITRI